MLRRSTASCCATCWAMKGQALAIALVIAAGVAMFVMYLSNFDSLQRDARARTTSGSGSPTCSRRSSARRRALERATSRRSPACRRVATRVVADVTLDVPGMAEPAIGRLISLPERGAPPLSTTSTCAAADGSSRTGPTRCSRARCSATRNSSTPGDRVAGRHQRPPALADDRRRRAVARVRLQRSGPARSFPTTRGSASSGWTGGRWPPRSTWRAASTTWRSRWRRARRPTRSSRGSIGCSSRTAGCGAIPRALQLSHWTLENELTQLQTFGFLLPLIFLRRRGVHPERRADARAGAAAPADRRAQGARLRQPRDRLALHQVGARDRAGRRVVGVAAGALLGTLIIGLYNRSSAFPSCTSACRRASSSALR